MTGKSPRKKVDALYWQSRLGVAQAHLEAAQQDHAQAPRLLRDVLGNLLPDGHERRYRRILSFKDEVHYGTRQATRDEAGRLLADLEALARWAQELP